MRKQLGLKATTEHFIQPQRRTTIWQRENTLYNKIPYKNQTS